MIERELAAVFVRVDGHTGGDNVVMAQKGDTEVLGAFTLEGLGLAADPVKKILGPTVGLALRAGTPGVNRRRSFSPCSVVSELGISSLGLR